MSKSCYFNIGKQVNKILYKIKKKLFMKNYKQG